MSSKNGTTRFLKEGTKPTRRTKTMQAMWLSLPLMILYDNIFYIEMAFISPISIRLDVVLIFKCLFLLQLLF